MLKNELQGGRAGAVFIKEDKIYRPSGVWSPSIHKLLAHLHKGRFNSAPKPFGFDPEGNEILSYVSGEVYNYPLFGPIATTEALSSAAVLLRRYHDATVSFAQSACSKNMVWMLPPKEPCEVICHGDYAPYNVALCGDKVVGMFDFDAAHPAPRVWDVAYAVYCWAPFKTNPDDSLGDLNHQISRAKIFCDIYRLTSKQRSNLVNVMRERIQALVCFMFKEAEDGNEAFIGNIKDGHHMSYLRDMDYLDHNNQKITDALLQEEQ